MNSRTTGHAHRWSPLLAWGSWVYTSEGDRVLFCDCGAAGIERADQSLDIVYDPADVTRRPTRLPDWSGLR